MGPDKCQYSPIVYCLGCICTSACRHGGSWGQLRSLSSLVCTVRHLVPLPVVATGHWGEQLGISNVKEWIRNLKKWKYNIKLCVLTFNFNSFVLCSIVPLIFIPPHYLHHTPSNFRSTRKMYYGFEESTSVGLVFVLVSVPVLLSSCPQCSRVCRGWCWSTWRPSSSSWRASSGGWTPSRRTSAGASSSTPAEPPASRLSGQIFNRTTKQKQ